MERINQYEFYDLGKSLRAIARFEGDTTPGAVIFDFLDADARVRALLTGKPIPLGVCRQAAEHLFNILDSMADAHFRTVNAQGNKEFQFPADNAPPIPGWRFNMIRHGLETFETIFSAEMRDATTYFVPRRGIYSTTALVDSADETFPADLRPYIPEKTREDWKSAGRCLAFNLLSASGFHVARAVEGTVEAYYQLFSGKPAGTTLHNWNDYVKELEKIAAAKPDPSPADKTLTELRQMKDDYRNPIMHPRVVLTEADARMLFDNGESLIIAMASEIKSAKQTKGGVQPALAVITGQTP